MGIGPSTKETSLHHFRDPLLEVVSADPEIDLMGVIIVGTPDADEEKHLVGTRAAVWAECMRADGAIVSSDGWGNSDVDYTNTVYQLGIRGIPVTGLNFSGRNSGYIQEPGGYRERKRGRKRRRCAGRPQGACHAQDKNA